MTIPLFDSASFLKAVSTHPGVYCMLDADGRILYVGKAKNLRNRLKSYFLKNIPSVKTQALVKQIHDIQVTITHSENEALILESNLIKAHRPRYNVLFRDDKSYPYLYLASEEEYPYLAVHRGAKRRPGRYFGPYPSKWAVRESLLLLQKLFRIRQCDDYFFRHRTRPCLQYQIKRCSAPCVGLIEPEAYAEDLRHATMFLEGKDKKIIAELVTRMEHAAAELDYEAAAIYRDQIANLRRVTEQQYVTKGHSNVDVVAVALLPASACIQILYIRDGRMLGGKTFFPKMPAHTSHQDILAEFLPQYYLSTTNQYGIPAEIIVDQVMDDAKVLSDVLTEQAGRRVTIAHQVRGDRARWLKLAQNNALQALRRRYNEQTNYYQRFQALSSALNLPDVPQRIECFDISHSQGEATVASCVVCTWDGPANSDYRRFNINGITPGDDYAAMKQALQRRYTRLQKTDGVLPDILLIDGGKGQLAQAQSVLAELQISSVMILGLAKGPGRKPGLEIVYDESGQGQHLPADSLALHLLQLVRDEAHRFAITGHRQRRANKRKHSTLETIPQIGSQRRRHLLQHFGGLQEVQRASVEELATVPGISLALAQKIFDALHEG